MTETEDKEKCNKMTQRDAIQLSERTGRGAFSQSSRSKGRGVCLGAEARRTHHCSPDGRECTPRCSARHARLLQLHGCQLSSPKGRKRPEARAEPISLVLYTQRLITQRGSVKVSSVHDSKSQEPIKRTAQLPYGLKSREAWKEQEFELKFTEESEQSEVESTH